MDHQRPLTTDRDRTRPVRRKRDRRLSAVAALALLAALAAAPPPATAASHRLSQGLPFSDVSGWEVSPDGQFAVYIHDAELDDARELWSVRVTRRRTGPAVEPPARRRQRRLPVRDQRRQPARGLPRRPGDRRPGRALQHPHRRPRGGLDQTQRGAAGGWRRQPLRISPDSTRVIYYRRPDRQTTSSTPGPYRSTAARPTRLRPFVTLTGSRVLHGAGNALISPDSERVLFYANFSNLAYFDLWSARVDGTGGIEQLTETTGRHHRCRRSWNQPRQQSRPLPPPPARPNESTSSTACRAPAEARSSSMER